MILTYYCAFTLIIMVYLLGSIPSAVWIGKKYYGIDIRNYGSKNAGTTNMLRVLGAHAAIPVFVAEREPYQDLRNKLPRERRTECADRLFKRRHSR